MGEGAEMLGPLSHCPSGTLPSGRERQRHYRTSVTRRVATNVSPVARTT
jgi:hypothetical protein